MVKLNISLIEKKCLHQQLQKSLTKEIDKDHLKKLTHLFMNEQYIDQIDEFGVCNNLRVIYLQKNFIKKIKSLDFAVNLTHLYLQHNEITKIEKLDRLVNLKKLYLGYNNIAVIEGLEKLINLTDLHVEKQRLAPGECLCFDPRSAKTLSYGLVHLNISKNKIISLNEINNFQKLVTLEAKDNLINNIADLTETVISLERLEHLLLQGNPVTKIRRYRENIIANSYSLVSLDENRISENSRKFLMKFKSEKLQQSRKKLELSLSEDITSSLNLPPAFKRSVSRAMFQNIIPKFSFPGISIVGDAQPQIIPPWKSATSIKAEKDNHVLPRPFWKNKRESSKRNCFPGQIVSFSSFT
ncbi:protein phosphatase 1 regulatory subunit 42-like isoform X1 [Phymastichus coffea]|uniref:protein phosphatase 1 regulatory subunit 42-like isoform X1 n=1 Tax=Phymastichus coffea TaxID=108790 RepID=UPI00273B2149|nr:protein phosphatase 1 regulatory subunit 42-like isoform X1 [Phymastichus coffea]